MEFITINNKSYNTIMSNLSHELEVAYYITSNIFFTQDIFENFKNACIVLCLLRSLFNSDQICFTTTQQTYNEFLHQLKINYKGKYGWQKIQQIFLDNFVADTDFNKSIVECTRDREFSSDFEIPKNWIIYAPLR